MKRWVCPKCSRGALGPAKPAKLATVRFCLMCSKGAPVLVARIVPALERRKRTATARREERRERSAEQARAHLVARWALMLEHEKRLGFTAEDRVVDWFARVKAIATFGRLPAIAFRARRSKVREGFTSGRAYYRERRIVVTLPKPGKDWLDGVLVEKPATWNKAEVIGTLLHEVAHIAVDQRVRRKEIGPTPTHGRLFWREVFRAVCGLTGRTIEWAPRLKGYEQQLRAVHEIAAWLEAGGTL